MTDMCVGLVLESLKRPRAAARRLLRLPIGGGAIIEAALAVACIGVLLGYVALRVSGGSVDPVTAAALDAPLLGVAAQVGMMTLAAVLTSAIGRLFGGTGGLQQAALVVVWLNGITLLFQLAQLAALAAAPPLAVVVLIASVVWLLWAYACFVAELHGFASTPIVLGVVVLTGIVLAFAGAMVAAVLGVTPQVVQ